MSSIFRRLTTATLLLLTAALWTANLLFPPNIPDNSYYARLVTDKDGEPLRAFAGKDGVWRFPVKPTEVSPRYIEALINYEDRWFYHHPGINPISLLRATYQNISHNRIISGGSTITMQVARILHPYKRTLSGKMQQMLRALQLEWRLSKDEILTLYLNHAPFGGNLEGVEAASRAYLLKPPQRLSHAEAALLAVLPQRPSDLRPDRHSQKAQKARDKVLARLTTLGVWPEAITKEARMEIVAAESPRAFLSAPLLSQRLVSNSNTLRIGSTIDGSLQQSLESLLTDYIDRYPGTVSAAVMVLDNNSGNTLAYLGSADFANKKRHGYVDMVRAVRSPGSTLKPFLYGLALDEGMIHSHSLLSDTPRLYGDYRPGNFNDGFSGPVTAEEALQRSLNLPAVQLLDHYGPRKFAAKLSNAGLKLGIPGSGAPNLSVILGGAGIRLEQLTGVFSALARDGKTVKPRFKQNQPLEERRLMSRGAAWITFRMLADNQRGEFAPRKGFAGRGSFAWKTGTSYGFRDAWAIGVSAKHTVGVWVGRPDGTPSPGQYGAVSAAPLLFTVASQLYDDKQPLPQPPEVSRATICHPLGIRKTEQNREMCHREHTAWLLEETAPPTLSNNPLEISHSNPLPLTVDKLSGKRLSTGCAIGEPTIKRFALWPVQMEPWLPTNLRRSELLPQIAEECVNSTLASENLTLTGIIDGSRYLKAGPNSPPPRLALSTLGGQGGRYWYLNGQFRRQTEARETLYLDLERTGSTQITVIDQAGNIDQSTVNLELAN